jgi:hypothetical protein
LVYTQSIGTVGLATENYLLLEIDTGNSSVVNGEISLDEFVNQFRVYLFNDDASIVAKDGKDGKDGVKLFRHKVSFHCQPIEDSSMTVDVEIISKSNEPITMDNVIAHAGVFRNNFTQPIISDFANIGFQGSYGIMDIQPMGEFSPLLLVMVSVGTGDVATTDFDYVYDTVVEF